MIHLTNVFLGLLKVTFSKKSARSYGHFKELMSPADFSLYGKLYLYRRRAYAYKHYSSSRGDNEAIIMRLDDCIARLNREMTLLCAPYGLLPSNRNGLSAEEFLCELDSFLDNNTKPE